MLLMGDEQSSPCFHHCHDSIPRRELTRGSVAVPVWQPFVTDFWFEFFCCCCSVAESCQLFVTPQTVAHQTSLSFTSSWSLLKLMSIELVMPSNYLILCCSLLLLPLFSPSIRIFSSESALHTRWPMYWCFSFCISPSSEYSGLISFRIDWFEFLFMESGTREASVTCWLRVSTLGTQRIGVQFSFCHWLGVEPPTGVSLLGFFICDTRTEMVPRRLWWGCSFNNSDSLAVMGLAEMILVGGLAQCLAGGGVYSLSHVWLFLTPWSVAH